MQALHNIFSQIDSFIWGPPLLILLVGTGVYLTIRLGCLQLRRLPLALSLVFGRQDKDQVGDISSFAALCTALSATIGTGNIVGVATAIGLGGPGALFWMWVAAFFGMSTKYAECLLAVKYRKKDANGEMLGGPMYYLESGVGSKLLAKMFAVFSVGVAFFGIGTFAQVNAIVEASQIAFSVPPYITATILTILVAIVTIGGINSISKVATTVVPFMAVLYIVACLSVLLCNYSDVPSAIALVIDNAFTGHAATGGFTGATMMLAIRAGVARGVFSNESGLGSAPMAAAAAKTDSCVRQGLISMTGTFFDTILICTMTGLTLVITGVWQGDLVGVQMTSQAFSLGLNTPTFGPILLSIGLAFFAFTTILGWNYYGERCIVYLLGVKAVLPYKIIFIGLIASGAFLQLDLIWIIADIVNGCMAIPNLIGVLLLRKEVIAETETYFKLQKTVNQQVASASISS